MTPHLTETRAWRVFGLLLLLANLGCGAWILATDTWPMAIPNLLAALYMATGFTRPRRDR